MSASQLFDAGLQPERTLLAWRRSCLSFAACSLVFARFSMERLGVFAVLFAVAAGGLAIVAYVLTALGYRRAQRQLHTRNASGTSGWPIVIATGSVLLIGMLCCGFLITASLR